MTLICGYPLGHSQSAVSLVFLTSSWLFIPDYFLLFTKIVHYCIGNSYQSFEALDNVLCLQRGIISVVWVHQHNPISTGAFWRGISYESCSSSHSLLHVGCNSCRYCENLGVFIRALTLRFPQLHEMAVFCCFFSSQRLF